MKMEYVAIVEMKGIKYNAILMCGLYGNLRTLPTYEGAKNALDSYVKFLAKGEATVDYSMGFGIRSEGIIHKIDKVYIKRRQVTDWEIL